MASKRTVGSRHGASTQPTGRTDPLRQSPHAAITAGSLAECVLWCLCDGKAGHENQVRGLVQAISAQCAVDCHTIRVQPGPWQCWNWLRGNFPEGDNLPHPHLILGAGHGTHAAMLAARRAHGGRTIVLMKPSWGRNWFDLCLIPAHDGLQPRGNIIITRGVLNTIRPVSVKGAAESQKVRKGLFLIGGLSKHHGWDEDSILRQVEMIANRTPDIVWTLTTSRRTPVSFIRRLQHCQMPKLDIVPWEKTPSDWVPGQLAAATDIWVSKDSVSMVYEAMTAGGRVGLLELTRLRQDRVTRGIQKLVDQGQLTSFHEWQESGTMVQCVHGMNEASRCAAIIHDLWLRDQAA